jgi:hypothetical protein
MTPATFPSIPTSAPRTPCIILDPNFWQFALASATTYRIKDRRETTALRQRSYHDCVHVVVDNLPSSLEVERVDGLIVAVVLIAVSVFGLTSVSRVCEISVMLARSPLSISAKRTVEEERIVGSSVANEPLHSANLRRQLE